MAVTVGETAADYLSVHLGLGLPATSLIMTGFLVAALMLQFAQRKYVPLPYWLAVVMISVVGTLDQRQSCRQSRRAARPPRSILFAAALIATFAVWYACERTLIDPHDLYDAPRGLLLARHSLHLCARHLGGRSRRRRPRPRLSSGRARLCGRDRHHRRRLLRFPAERHPRLLARLYPDAADGCVIWRLFLATACKWGTWLGHDHHQSCVSRLHRCDYYLYDPHQGGAANGPTGPDS